MLHRTNLANITGRYSCSRNSKNYFSDVTHNYFYSDSRKVPRIKGDVLTPVKFNTLRQPMYKKQIFPFLSVVRNETDDNFKSRKFTLVTAVNHVSCD